MRPPPSTLCLPILHAAAEGRLVLSLSWNHLELLFFYNFKSSEKLSEFPVSHPCSLFIILADVHHHHGYRYNHFTRAHTPIEKSSAVGSSSSSGCDATESPMRSPGVCRQLNWCRRLSYSNRYSDSEQTVSPMFVLLVKHIFAWLGRQTTTDRLVGSVGMGRGGESGEKVQEGL